MNLQFYIGNSPFPLTLCGLKTRRFFKTCLKRIVNYPPRRSRQLPVRQVLQLRLLLIFLLLLWVHQFLMLNAPWFTIACLPRLQLCRDEINQGFLLNKTLLCADGYSYLLINSIMSRRINRASGTLRERRWHFLHASIAKWLPCLSFYLVTLASYIFTD